MNKIIDGKRLQSEKIVAFKEQISNISDKLKLVVIQIGNDTASIIYVKNKKILCEKVGISFEHLWYDSITEDELIEVIDRLNNDDSVTGILVQFPLPGDIDANKVIDTISPLKDVDGLTTYNMGALASGQKCLVPCTALGIVSILDSICDSLEGLDIVIVGRSRLVGWPLASLLLRKNATVTVCHSKTVNLKEKTLNADVLVVAAGKKHLIKEDYVKDDAVVIDVGITREDGKLYGDCDFDNIASKCKYITPVPGGVGPLTVTYLINNVIEAYYLQKK